jgi:hypothetical protein
MGAQEPRSPWAWDEGGWPVGPVDPVGLLYGNERQVPGRELLSGSCWSFPLPAKPPAHSPCVMPWYGRCPVNISQRHTPKAHTSVALLTLPPNASCGGERAGVAGTREGWAGNKVNRVAGAVHGLLGQSRVRCHLTPPRAPPSPAP